MSASRPPHRSVWLNKPPNSCLIEDCHRIRAGGTVFVPYAPLCEPHMIDAWRWVQHQPDINPSQQAIEQRATEQAHEAWAAMPRVVYYAQLRHGAVKIGTTIDLKQRIKQLRLDWPAAVLAVEPGGYDVERTRHRQFEAEQHLGADGNRIEDFEPSDELMAHIERVRRQHGDPTKVYRYTVTGRWDYETA